MARIELEKLTKAFGSLLAVDAIDLDIADGEFVVLVGPSGCGKTTTLNLISGLEQPTSGTIRIGDRAVNDVDPAERGLGMVFQSLALFPHMTVFENIAFGLRVKKVPRGEVIRRVMAAAETMKIPHILSKRPGQLSGGEAQRVALARTVVTNPAVFLMDEPLSSLDAKLRVEMRTELKRLHAELGSTFVYVTHDQAEAMTMADIIVVMKEGHIQQMGSPLDIYRDPANQFVAGFFGVPSMNFVTGRAAEDGGRLTFESPHIRHAFDRGAPLALRPRKVDLGVRPEHVRLGEGPHRAPVGLLEPLGDQVLVFLDYGGPSPLITKVPADRRVTLGSEERFGFKPEAVLLFDSESGERLL